MAFRFLPILNMTLLSSLVGGMAYIAFMAPKCPTPSFAMMQARSLELVTVPNLSVSHSNSDGEWYSVDYKGFVSVQDFLAKNPDCCQDVTEKFAQEGLDVTAAISVSSTWPPITAGSTENYVLTQVFLFDECGSVFNPLD